MEKKSGGKASDHLANERTFLAWIRTSIGIMGFGFVVVKFSLFVRQISLMLGHETSIQQKGYSGIIGVVLVVLGALVSLLAFFNYKNIERQIEADHYSSSSPMTTVLTTGILIISILLVWYLVESIS